MGTGVSWRGCLLPAGWAFMGLARLKAQFYSLGWARTRTLPAPCISVGNITFGGTGKTPFTVFLARKLQALGFNPAVLLRGYGRKWKGPLLVGADAGWLEAGDEALVLRDNLPGVPVIVGAGRLQSSALAPPGVNLFILDDGFQHQKVARDLDIVLVDASRPFDLRPPPLGRLREPLSALSRADLCVMTRSKSGEMPHAMALRWAGRPRIETEFRWEEAVYPVCGKRWNDLAGIKIAAFSGVGNPMPFFDEARARGLTIASALPFPDHAEPTRDRISSVRAAISSTGAQAVLCTEKDAVKWVPVWREAVPLIYPRLEVDLRDPTGTLDNMLAEAARSVRREA